MGAIQAGVPAAPGLPRPQRLPAPRGGHGVSWCDLADVRWTGRASSAVRRACLQKAGLAGQQDVQAWLAKQEVDDCRLPIDSMTWAFAGCMQREAPARAASC